MRGEGRACQYENLQEEIKFNLLTTKTHSGLDFAGSYVLLKAFQQLCAPSGMKVTSGWQPSLILVWVQWPKPEWFSWWKHRTGFKEDSSSTDLLRKTSHQTSLLDFLGLLSSLSIEAPLGAGNDLVPPKHSTLRCGTQEHKRLWACWDLTERIVFPENISKNGCFMIWMHCQGGTTMSGLVSDVDIRVSWPENWCGAKRLVEGTRHEFLALRLEKKFWAFQVTPGQLSCKVAGRGSRSSSSSRSSRRSSRRA